MNHGTFSSDATLISPPKTPKDFSQRPLQNKTHQRFRSSFPNQLNHVSCIPFQRSTCPHQKLLHRSGVQVSNELNSLSNLLNRVSTQLLTLQPLHPIRVSIRAGSARSKQN